VTFDACQRTAEDGGPYGVGIMWFRFVRRLRRRALRRQLQFSNKSVIIPLSLILELIPMDDESKRLEEDQEPQEGREAAQEGREAAQEGPQEEKASFKMDLYFWVQALALALVFLVITFTLVGRVIRVVGSSMVPTLHEGDMMLLQSVGYEPRQGDVVVLRKETFMNEPVVKRVIAVGGQHVRVDYNTHLVYVDDVPLNEPYINEIMNDPHHTDLNVLDVVVPEGSIYVLGDNRNLSSDSRNERLGTVDTRYVLGRALWVVFPFRDFGPID